MAVKVKYKRILLKLSGEVLEGKKGAGIDFSVVDKIAQEVLEIKKLGVQVAIVIGGGNFWRYRDFKESGISRVHSDHMGMMATVMNSVALANGFRRRKLHVRVLSALPVKTVTEPYDSDLGKKYLEAGEVVICAGGTGNPFFTTDTAASLRALELECDVLLKATKVDFVYDKDPMKYKDAKKFKKISYKEVLEKKLEVMDLSSISMCMSDGMKVQVFNQTKPGNLAKVVKGMDIGTIIS